VEPGWRPTLASADPRSFTMADLIRFAVPDQAVRSEARAPAPTG
jgi:hypothetical protein